MQENTENASAPARPNVICADCRYHQPNRLPGGTLTLHFCEIRSEVIEDGTRISPITGELIPRKVAWEFCDNKGNCLDFKPAAVAPPKLPWWRRIRRWFRG